MSDDESSDNSPAKRNLLSSFNVSKMIELIKERPTLWCKTDPRYRNRELKDRSWREILQQFEPNCDALSSVEKQELISILIKKWCNIRDSYRKYVTSRLKTTRPYVYAEQLSFLKAMVNLDANHSNRKRRYSFVDKAEPQDTQDIQDVDEPPEEWINEVYVDMDEDEPEPHKSYHSDVSHSLKDSDTNSSTVSVLVNLLQKEEDEDRAFFMSIVPSVKQLSPEHKFEFRIQVLKLLKQFRKREHIKNLVKSERNHLTDSD